MNKTRHAALKRALMKLEFGECMIWPLAGQTAHHLQAIIHHYAGGGVFRSLKRGDKLFIVRVE